MATPQTPARDSFRVPNSVIQDLTTNTASDLNGPSAFPLVTLLGLLTAVAPKAPHKEVRMRLSQILEIIAVSKQVALAVDREWKTADGVTRKNQYRSRRFSPKHLQQVHGALLTLFQASVCVQRWDKEKLQRLDRQVHILDMFGYVYEHGGKALDLDDLPPDREKINVGSDERPVWRVRRQTHKGGRFDRPTAIMFRLNAELANELSGRSDTVKFTIIARKVFTLFRQYMNQPTVIRLVMLVLRQTAPDFRRNLRQLITDLGFDVTHPVRAMGDLRQALTELQQHRLVTDFTVDSDNDMLAVSRNPDWHREVVTCP
jgi:hypothetical protein